MPSRSRKTTPSTSSSPEVFKSAQKRGFLLATKGVAHPQGAAAGVREIVIRQTQIVEVVHPGYEDAEDVVFASEQRENAVTPPKKSPPTSPKAVARPVKDAKDPFKELRNKGKQT